MPHTRFRFYGPLNDFLRAEQRQRSLVRFWEVTGSVKDMIEGFGVPHPEVELILCNGGSVAFDYQVRDRDRVSVYPRMHALPVEDLSLVRAPPLAEKRFVLDTHLGKLAGYLRMMGIDTLYRNDYDDSELAEISAREQRILLTRDQKLLMRTIVTYGYWPRSGWPEQQLREVMQRYSLEQEIEPFTRCLRCNSVLAPVAKAEIAHLLEPETRRHYHRFARCPGCDRVYWEGSHHARMQGFIDEVLSEIGSRRAPRTP